MLILLPREGAKIAITPLQSSWVIRQRFQGARRSRFKTFFLVRLLFGKDEKNWETLLTYFLTQAPRPGKMVIIPILTPVLFRGHQYPEIPKLFMNGGSQRLLAPEAIFVPAGNPQKSSSGTGLETESPCQHLAKKERSKKKKKVYWMWGKR
jgi:hypothetical protein